jgi:membrane protein DedA with SNARE-associated domain
MNYAFGLTRIDLREYVLASFVSMAPGALAYTYLGYAGREAVSGQTGAVRKALLALALLAAIAFLARLARRIKGQRFMEPATPKSRLESSEEVGLIDVRTADEFRGPLGHI